MKIIGGYIFLCLFVLFVFVIIYFEKSRVHELQEIVVNINKERKNINKVYLYMLRLASQSESIITWDISDFNKYRDYRLKVGSILCNMKSYDLKDTLRSEYIDSLLNLLEIKESHLFHIMEALISRKSSDSIIADRLPVLAENFSNIRITTRKKSGLAGLLGGKEKILIPYNTDALNELNEIFFTDHDSINSQMKVYDDSLQLQNQLINHNLYKFISFLDEQVEQSFLRRSEIITKCQHTSFNLFISVIIVMYCMIVISFIKIRSDLRNEEKVKLRLKQAISENENLLEMRKKIILTVSHDIRGPLGNIHNCADLASETRQKKKRDLYLEDIRHSCHHILHLVNDLMDAYRINEAGDLRNDTPFYLDRFLQRISDEFSRKAVVKALFFQSEHQNSSFVVKGDADKLEQVLANLLTNAIKFTPSGTISFYSKYLEGKLHIEIRDTGIGMDEETQKRIFAPFERAAQNVNSEGFGLGLFLTKGLIKVLNGIITMESAPGKGSIFRLEIPLPETDELVEEDKTDSDSITILPKNVLVVDDDPILLKIAEDMLGRKGISCTTCMNFQEVVAALGKSDYDIVLTDLQMPDTDGFVLLRLLRNSDIGNSRTIPVAVMTARGDGNSGIYEKEGFAGCIHKPFNIHALLTFLSTVMSQTKISQTGDFDFSCLLDNTDDYGHMLSLVLMESRKEIEELTTAIKTINRESIRKTIHRMMPVWEMLEKEQLLRDFQEKLHDMDISDDVICENAIRIIEWIEKLINETENELKKYENSDC